jgi:predicted Rdx family selenoprotein
VAAALKEAFGVEAELIPGAGGILEVKKGNVVIWTNRNGGGLPNPQVVVEAMRQHAP